MSIHHSSWWKYQDAFFHMSVPFFLMTEGPGVSGGQTSGEWRQGLLCNSTVVLEPSPQGDFPGTYTAVVLGPPLHTVFNMSKSSNRVGLDQTILGLWHSAKGRVTVCPLHVNGFSHKKHHYPCPASLCCKRLHGEGRFQTGLCHTGQVLTPKEGMILGHYF